MSNGEKQYYDRDDLDEDEQKLFDEMVLEEMAKLENQLMKSSVEDVSGSHNYSIPRSGDTDQYSDRYAADQPSSYYRNGSASHSQKSEQSHPYDAEIMSASTGRSAYRSGDEFYRNAPRINVDEVSRRSPLQNNRRGHSPYSPGMSSNSPDKADAESRHSQRDSRHHSDGYSSSPLQSPRNNVRRLREPEPEPESPSNMRSESRFSQNGGSPAMTSSLPSRYGARTTEDTNRYDSVAEDRNIPREDNRLSLRRYLDDDSAQPEEANPLSSIGESSHQMSTQRRKEQQAEYAQQLLNQQTYRQQQSDAPIRGVSPRSPPGDTVLYSPRSRRDSINHPDNSRPVSGRSGVVNFGSDPDAEAAKKREMKMAYGKQLQDQQHSNQSIKGYEVSGSARTDVRSEAVSSSRNSNGHSNSNSGKEDERSNAVSAAELKKMQQRKYYDEITAAAAASPITSARKALKGGPLSRHEQLKAGMADSYDNNPKDGGYTTPSNHLSCADAERVESRLKKIQLQQLYAKQLSDDASALNATPSGRISTSGNGSRRISSARIDPRASSQAASSAGGDGKGLFGSMSEADQLASALAKKKAAQLEYYQQLQEAENVRAQHQSDPQMNRRASLYRTRDQKEQDDARGRSREDRQTPPVGVGRDTGSGSGYGQRGERGRYQDQVQDPRHNGYGSAKAMQVTSAMHLSRNIMEGGGNTTRQREGQGQRGHGQGGQGEGELDEFYSRTPHSIVETGRVTDSYSTQRDPDHGRNHHSNGCEHGNSRSDLDSRQRGAYSHPSDRHGERDRDTVQDGYEVAADDRYQDRMPNRRELPRDTKVEQHRYNDSEGHLGQNRMRDEDHGRQFDEVRTRDDDMRYQEKELLQGSGRLGQSSSGYEPSRGAPSHMRVSESRIRLENPSVQMSSGRKGVDDEGDRDSNRDRDRDRDRNRDGYPSGQGRNYDHSNSPPDNRTSPPYDDVRDRAGYDTYSPSSNPQRSREVNSDRLSDKSNRQHINYTASDSHSSQYGGSGSASGAGPGYDRDRGGVSGRPMVQNTVAGRGRSSGGGVSSITL